VRVVPTVFADPIVLGRTLAERIADEIEAARSCRRHYVLGCPGGRTPMSTYAELVRIVAGRGLDLSHVVIAMMDEYLTTDPRTGEHRLVDDELPHSCRRFGREVIVGPLCSAVGRGKDIAEDRFWVPDPATPDAYDQRIAEIGGIDLFLLACGASDGHVGFNPPGSPVDSTTRVVRLAQSTRRDNVVTFPTLRTPDQAPEYGVTVGVDTILRHSRSAVMVVHGADKAEAAARIQAAESYDPSWPATLVNECHGAALFLDRAAAVCGR
jgi:glucosamine-6-phosphate deaminase